MKELIVCAYCKSDVYVYPSRVNRTGGFNYCNRACQTRHRETKSNHPSWRGGLVPRTCEECGAAFAVKAKEVKKGAGRFCSCACSIKRLARENSVRLVRRIEKRCQVCDKVILVKPSHAEKEGMYCSRNCLAVAFQARYQGDSNPNFKDGGSIGNTQSARTRRARLKKNGGKHTATEWVDLCNRYGNKCLCCEMTGVKLTKDHVLPVVQGGHSSIDNLQPLCHRCNRKKHGRQIDYRPSPDLGVSLA